MTKKEKNLFIMNKYTKKLVLFGFLGLLITFCFLIYKSNSSKTQIASNVLNSYINKDYINEDKNFYYKYKAPNKFDCSTYITIDNGLKSKTSCSIENTSLIVYSGEKEDLIITLNKLDLSMNSGLFVTKIQDFLKNGFTLNVKVDNISMGDIILNKGLDLSKEQLSDNSKQDLEKIFKEFKDIDLNGIAKIKPINIKDNIFNVDIKGTLIANNWGLNQVINLNFISYDKPKEIIFKDTVSEEEVKQFDSPPDAITELKIVLPNEMFVNKNFMAFSATKGVDNLLDIFYSYYKVMFETKVNKNEYNKYYLNVDSDKIVDKNTFVSIMKDLTSIAATEYELSINAPLSIAIKNLFAGNFGSCYKAEVVDPNKNISLEYLMELIKKNPIEGNNLSKALYNRTIFECTKSSEDCFKKCDF